MAADDNRAVVRRFIDEVFNNGNLSVAEEVLSPDYVHHDPATGETGSGVDGLEQMVNYYRKAFPDFKVTVEDQIATEDRVVDDSIISFTITRDGFLPFPIGQKIEMRLAHIFEMRGGKISKEIAFEMPRPV